jgi:hypothetical protein
MSARLESGGFPALAPPSAEAKRQLACKSVDPESDEIAKGSGKAITECVRVDAKGKVINTQYRLVSQEERHAKRDPEDGATRKKAGTPRKASTPVANPHAWAQDPWRAQQQQWGWQWGSGQQWREERREWRSPQSTWGSWR